MRKHRSSFLLSLLMVVLCGSIIIGSTLAYFTSEQTTGENIIAASTLEAGLDWAYQLPESESGWQNAANGVLFNETSWEPNYSAARYIRVKNGGSLAFSYELNVLPTMVVEGGPELMDVIDVYYGVVDADTPAITRSNFSQQLTRMGTMTELLSNEHGAGYGILLPEGVGVENLPTGVEGESGTVTACIVLHMQQGAGNEYMGLSAGEGFKLQLAAVQYNYDDAFANIPNPSLPDVNGYGTEVIKPLESVQGGVLTADMVFTSSNGVTATVPAGAKVEPGATQLKLIVTPKAQSDANVELEANEVINAWDVCVEGLAKDNTTPVRIAMGAVMQKALNIGNYDLYHVEGDATNKMTRVDVVDETSAHNSYSYDPATGEVEVAMATFSDVTVVIDEVNAWKGVLDDSWYTDANATSYTIYNADQLAYFGKKVAEGTQFENKTVTLASDINLGAGTETYVDGSKVIFYSIGTSVDYKQGTSPKAFAGTFDGAGHIITGLYQNGWEMGGNYDNGYFKNAMGLFGLVENGTVQNLTLDRFEMVMEFAPMGCVTAYVDGECTFKNIAVFNSHPQTYNTAVAGIAGWDRGTSNLIFENITVDNSNMISALWGTYDCCAGGILGYLGENSFAQLTNCHVAAQLDVYNDACANYQYYWYRYCGMLIGTVDGTVKDANGYTIPDISRITIEGCSVDYGNWNNYKYCEFETLGKGSYNGPGEWKFCRTDDSRCVAGHSHEDYESHEVLLPFKQLFGGYGWGVKGIESHEKVVVKSKMQSVEKFKIRLDKLTVGKEYKLFELFDEISDEGVVDAAVQLGITVSEANGAKYEYVQMDNPVNWRDNTLKFTEVGDGKVHLTIQDYYYCIPTSVDLTVEAPEDVEKFIAAFDHDPDTDGNQNYLDTYLYRVGNQNTVKLGSLFEALSDVTGSVNVTIDAIDDCAVSGTYVKNASDWTQGTIQFSGTGPVAVTIDDEGYTKPYELILEVVDAINTTENTNATDNNVVLLNNLENGSFSVNNGKALYGNGFTITLNPNSHTTKRGAGFDGYIHLNNGTLDNVVIVGPVYPVANIYRDQGETGTDPDSLVKYFRNAVICNGGNCEILNSYISGTRAAVYVKDAKDLRIENTTVSGGAYANIEVTAAQRVIFENLTTEQVVVMDSYGQKVERIGMGIVVNSPDIEVYLEGELCQYNWVDKDQWKSMLGGYESSFPKLYTDNTYSDYWHYREGDLETNYVNVAIVFACEMNGQNAKLYDNRINKTLSYVPKAAKVNDVNGVAYSVTNAGTLTDEIFVAPNYYPNTQAPVPPKALFDYTTKNNRPQITNTNDFCYYDNATGNYILSFSEGDSGIFETDILTVTKGNRSIAYEVRVSNGAALSDDMSKITFEDAGDYVVTYSYYDDENYRLGEGTVQKYTVDYQKHVNITVYEVTDTSAKTTFDFGNNGYRVETANNLNYVMPDVNATVDSNKAGIGVTTVDGKNIYYPIVSMHKSGSSSWYNYFSVFEAVTITDLNGSVHDTDSTEMPSNLTVIGGFILDANGNVSTKESANGTGIFDYSTGKKIKCDTYSNYGLCYYPDSKFSGGTSDRAEQTIVVKYRYTDSIGGSYYYYVGYWCEEHTESCVTPDTLVTLADGTQKEIQYVTYEDRLLVWDFYNGEYTTVPAALIVNHGRDNYRIIELLFEDGTRVKAVTAHAFFDADENKFVLIDSMNVSDYIGHRFAKHDANSITYVELIDFKLYDSETESYTLVSSEHYNFITEEMFSLTNAFHQMQAGLVVGKNMKYDEKSLNTDIEAYGLYSYDSYSDYITEEQFVAFGGPYLKISVEKGYTSYQYTIDLIEQYLK